MTATTSLDPRTKLFMVLAISSLAVLLQDAYFLAVIWLYTLAILVLFKCDLSSMFYKMKRFIWVFVFMVFIQSIFTRDGESIVSLFNITLITDMGLRKGIQIVLRFLILISSALIVSTSNSREIIQALVMLKIPYELAFMVSVAIRFLPLLNEELTDITTAIQLRGVNLKDIPPLKRLKTYSYLLMPMISSVIIKSQELSVAMEMRAFRAYPRRTNYKLLVFKTVDYAYILVSLVFFASILLFYYRQYKVG